MFIELKGPALSKVSLEAINTAAVKLGVAQNIAVWFPATSPSVSSFRHTADFGADRACGLALPECTLFHSVFHFVYEKLEPH